MNSEAKTGIIVLLVVAVSIVAVSRLTGLGRRGTYDVTVHFKDLNGLPVGAPVRLDGVKIGEVLDVGLRRRTEFPGHLAFAKLRLKEDRDGHMTVFAGDRFQIASGSFLGDKHVKVTRGEERLSRLVDGDVVGGSGPGGLDALTAQAEGIADQARDTLSGLDEIIGDEQLQADVKGTFANLRELSAKATEVADRALSLVSSVGDAESQKIRVLIDNLTEVSKSLRRTAAGVNALVSTTTVPEDMERISRNLVDASEDVQKLASSAEDLISDPKVSSDIRTTLGNARDTTASTRVAVDKAIEVLDHTNNIVGRVDEATAKVQGIGQALSDVEAEGRADVRAGSGPAGRIDVSVDLYPDRYKDSFWRVGARDLGGDEMLDLQFGLPLGHRDERLRVGIMENELGVGWDRRWSERFHSEVELLNPDAFRLDLKGRYRYDRDWDLIFGMDRVLSGTEPFAGARYNFDF